MKTPFELIEANGLTLHGDIEHFAEVVVAENSAVLNKEIDRLKQQIRYQDQRDGRIGTHIAWMVYTQDGQSVYVTDNPTDIQEGQRALPLYTAPPQRPWVGLTESEMGQLIHDHCQQTGKTYRSLMDFAIANALNDCLIRKNNAT
jgi:hypothetical protein